MEDYPLKRVSLYASKALRSDPSLALLYYLTVAAGGLTVKHVRPPGYIGML